MTTWDPAPRHVVHKHPTAEARAVLLAIDLGLRCGFAAFDEDGDLVGYHSTHFPRPSMLRATAWKVLMRWPNLRRIVVEGDPSYAALWQKLADKRGIAFSIVRPETWRARMLKPRQCVSGQAAKQAARNLSRRIIAASTAPRPKGPMTTDVCEAIVIGAWAALADLP